MAGFYLPILIAMILLSWATYYKVLRRFLADDFETERRSDNRRSLNAIRRCRKNHFGLSLSSSTSSSMTAETA